MRGEGAETLKMGSRVVMRSIRVGAWSIPGATEVLSVVTMAGKLTVKTNCTPHPVPLHLLQVWTRDSSSDSGKQEPAWRCLWLHPVVR